MPIHYSLAPPLSVPDLDTAQVDTGDLAEKRTGGNLDTHGRVCDVIQIHVVEVETEREAGLAHAEITGTRSWAEEKERKREKYIN